MVGDREHVVYYPLFTFTSSVITEIGEVIIVIGMAFYQKWQENRQQKLRNQILQEVMQIANDKHAEWVKWAESGGTESRADPPSPPEKPIQSGNDENK